MIKKILYIVTIITTLLWASCSDDTHLDKEVGADYLFSLSLQTNDDVNTRANTEPGVDDLHENKVEKVELFFYDGDALIWQVRFFTILFTISSYFLHLIQIYLHKSLLLVMDIAFEIL